MGYILLHWKESSIDKKFDMFTSILKVFEDAVYFQAEEFQKFNSFGL